MCPVYHPCGIGPSHSRSLASKPLGFAECDEIDGYPLDVDGEGDDAVASAGP